MEEDCPFCHPGKWGSRMDLLSPCLIDFPVTSGHMLLIPKRHVADWFETTAEERHDLLASLMLHVRCGQERRPDGFNLGVNVGQAAGQTVFHVHLHLIPDITATWRTRGVGSSGDPLGKTI